MIKIHLRCALLVALTFLLSGLLAADQQVWAHGSSTAIAELVKCERKLSQSFNPPSTSIVVKLKFEQPTVALKERKFKESARLLKISGIAGDVHTVFYPFSSYDAVTPSELFPDATTILAVDVAPFVRDTKARVKAEFYEGEVDDRFLAVGQSLDVPSIANALVMRLAQTVQNFRLLGVEAIVEANPEQTARRVHGIIRYDTGDGTPVRSYIHINWTLSTTGSTSADKKAWWYRQLKKRGLDAMILKASMGGLAAGPNSFGPDVMKALIDRGGVFVDGDGLALSYRLGPQPNEAIFWLPGFKGYTRGSITIFGQHQYDLRKFEPY